MSETLPVKPTVLDFDAKMWGKFPQEFKLLDECLRVGDLIYEGTQKAYDARFRESPYHICLHYLLLRAIPSFVATCQVVSAGFIEEGHALFRRTLEALINARYIQLEPDTHSQLFLRFGYMRGQADLPKLTANQFLTPEMKKALKELQAQYQRDHEDVRGLYKVNRNGEIFNEYSRDWSGKSIRRMAEDCGLGSDYWYGYHLSSMDVHMSGSTVGKYLDFESRQFRYSQSADEYYNLLRYTARVFLMFLLVIDSAFSLETAETIRETASGRVSLCDGPFS